MTGMTRPGDRRHSPSARFVRRSLRQPGGWAGLLILSVVILSALCAPWLAPFPPDAVDLRAQLQPPGPGHPAGTDFFGRDMLSRLLYGARATLGATTLAVAVGLAPGTLLGLAAGYLRGWPGQLLVALIDLILAFPALLLALLIVALLGPSLLTLAIAVGVAGVPGYARLARSIVRSTRTALFVLAAEAAGATAGRILLRHLLPSVVTPVIAWATLDVARVILSVAGLGFLGLGTPPPAAEWGLMLYEGRAHLASAPWTSACPGLAVSLTVLGATLLGDALSAARNDRS